MRQNIGGKKTAHRGVGYFSPPCMEAFHLAATDRSPRVHFDPSAGVLELSGRSIHENAAAFYERLFERIDAYAAHPAPQTHAVIALEYFNSSTAKCLLDILKRLDELHAGGGSRVSLEWRYEDGDLDMQEAGNDFRALLEMPVKLKAGRG